MANRATTTVSRVLAPLGRVSLDARPAVDALELLAAGHRFRIEACWAGEGFPEDVRRVLATLSKVRPGPGAPTTVVAARRLSPGARRLLREHALSWADETGAAHIVANPGLLVDRDGDRPLPLTARPWSWSAAAAALGEAVLARSARTEIPTREQPVLPPAADLARRAGVSVSMVNTTLRAWAALGWVEKRGGQRGPTSTRLLVAPGELLRSWAVWTASTPAPELAIDADITDAITWVQTELPKAMPRKGTWCLGGAAASALVARGQAAISRVLCHVEAGVFDLLCDSMGQRASAHLPGNDARLVLRAAPKSTIALADPGPVPLASAPRIYADLVSSTGADSEATTDFRKVAFGF